MRQGVGGWCVIGLKRVVLMALCLAGLCLSTLANTCDPTPPPPAAGKNVWHCANDSDTVVVFVHGLYSDNVAAWKSLASQDAGSGTYWPNLVLADNNLKQPSVYLAGFYTELGGAKYGMKDAANELYSALSTPSGPQPSVLSKKNILFVAHSLGGVIVRDVLVHRTDAFAGKRVGLLLVASPSGGSHYAQFLASAAAVAGDQLVKELAIDSPFLQQLHVDFLELLGKQRIPGLVGTELIENRMIDSNMLGGSPAMWVAAKIWGRIVEKESAARYFARQIVIPNSDHFTIARPTGLNDYAHRELVSLFNRMQAVANPSCEPPSSFRLVLNVNSKSPEIMPVGISEDFKAHLPLLKLLRTKPDGTLVPGLTDEANRDPTTKRHLFSPGAPFPCPGEAFRAKLLSIPITSHLDARDPELTDLCFRRSAIKIAEQSAFLRCTHPGHCQPDHEAPGLAESCVKIGWWWPELIESAHGQERQEGSPFWAAPSLSTLINLPAEDKPGYAEFTIRSGAIAGISGANGISFGLIVNSVPVYFDGVKPHTEVMPFNSADGVRFTFGIENLGFTGGEDGYERLELEVRYWKDGKLVKEAKLNRLYVSYRHARLERIEQADGDIYEWVGY
ncbi:MAG: hypothetical protein WBX25_26540, partial [Rhodomicrobium sp.]